MQIREAERSELDLLLELDHTYETEKVWQMESETQEGKPNAKFRIARLPRPMKVQCPQDPQLMESNWKRFSAILVAEENENIPAYIALSEAFENDTVWVLDGVVHPLKRRKGIGTALLLHAQRWAVKQSKRQIALALQSKNYPAIQLAQKLGFEFSGYHDHFFGNRDIALFFSKELD